MIVSAIFNLIMNIVFLLVTVIVAPIDALLSSMLPDLSNALGSIGDYIQVIAQGLGWALSATGIPVQAIGLIGMYFGVILLLKPIVYTTKLGIKWYKAVKG